MACGDRGNGQELERYRPYLAFLVRLQIDPDLRGKVDLSGVVQVTLLEAHQAWEKVRPLSEPQQLAWLRQALAHNLTDEVRKVNTAGRDFRRERSLEDALEASSARIEAWLADDQSSPSHRAIRNEQLFRVARAMADLPEDQRTAVELHHFRGWPLQQIAESLGRSKAAVAKLLYRGIEKLHTLLDDPDGR